MQVSKRHLPIVGLLGLVIVAAAGGSIYYYQFVVPHPSVCGVAVHRLLFMRAIIQELGGFSITNAVTLLNGTAPVGNGTTPPSLARLLYQNLTVADPKTITANVGDTVTLYVHSVNANDTRQYASATGHGFELDQYSILDTNLAWGTWKTFTFTVMSSGTTPFKCAQSCSDHHTDMVGTFSAGCSA